MTGRVAFWSTLIVFCLTMVAGATIYTVSVNPGSGQYYDLQSAQNASAAGDTILVGPGTYASITVYHQLHLIGAGWDVCTVNVAGTGFSMVGGASRTIVEGFRINATGYGSYIYSTNDSIVFRRCLINSGYAIGIETGRLFVEDCILYCATPLDIVSLTIPNATGNLVFRNTVFAHGSSAGYAQAIEGTHGGVVEIYNCVFLNVWVPFNLYGTAQVVGLNNIFWDWPAASTYGTLPAGSVFEYTAAGSNNPAFPAGFNNNISLSSNNPFVNYNNANHYQIGISDLHLNNSTGGLACTDTGYPSIQDLDASPCDLGVYGGPKPVVENGVPAYPFAITLTIDNLVEVGDSVGVSSTGRIGPRY